MKHFVALLVLFLNTSAYAFQSILEKEAQYLADKSIEITRDKKGSHTITSIQSAGEWTVPSFKAGLVLPEPGIYWLRFTLRNTTHQNNWILEFPDIHNSEMDIYQLSPNGAVRVHSQVGFDRNFYPRMYDHKNYFFDINLSPGESGTYYVRIKSRYRSSYGAYIRSTGFQFSYFLREYYLLGFFYGILFIMAMYNFFLFIFTKEKNYAFYVLYVVAGALYTLNEDGIGFHFLWPSLPGINHFLFVWSPFLFLSTFMLYASRFLEFSKRFPQASFILLAMLLLNFIVILASSYVPSFVRAIFYVIPFFYAYWIALLLYRRGYRASRFFVVGFSIVLLSFVLYFFRMMEWIPTNLYTYYVFNVGMILEVVIMSYALGDRYRILKEEREAAHQKIISQLHENEKLKDKVNRELEEKVMERTHQLEERSNELASANAQLQELTAQLNKMNSSLDKDNWELKKLVKEETRSRILQEKVSYEEYLQIYPNDHACLSFLEKIKWEEGYTCKKCGNTSYRKTDKTFSRRCTKCKYIESVTAGTLFHGIKFPLNKAFYIVYDTYDEKSRSTIDTLSEKIDLRRVTVWMFRKKVLEAYLKKPRLKDSGWESLIQD